jgi:hypothetical protein
MHLNADELIDLAEGTRPEASAPHLAGCDRCRGQLAELRAMMSTITTGSPADVPEPSPLFWDHLSERVGAAVAAEHEPRFGWLDAAAWRRLLLPVSGAAIASLVVAVVIGSRLLAPPAPSPDAANPTPAPPPAVAESAAADRLGDPASSGDESLTLVASLAEHLDLDDADEAGLAAGGSAEHAVTHLSDDDLRELRRVLKEELARWGA